MKPQTIRLLDVGLVGPVMLVGGLMLSRSAYLLGLLLGLLGLLTILYNGRNWRLTELAANA